MSRAKEFTVKHGYNKKLPEMPPPRLETLELLLKRYTDSSAGPDNIPFRALKRVHSRAARALYEASRALSSDLEPDPSF